jgi:tRNA1Val (adenine37-N6)-methyltransferase
MTHLATTVDSIYRGRLTLEQPAKSYRFGSDAMALAAALHAQPGQQVLELGCGVGAVLLAAQSRLPEVYFTGIERETAYTHLANKNIRHNRAQDYISIVQGDIADKELFKQLGSFDHVVANPPYYDTERHSAAEDDLRRVAHQHAPEDLGMWLQSANRFLKPKGSITMIHSVEKLDEIIQGLKKFCGAIRIFPLWPQQNQSCKRIIIHALKGSKTPLSIMPGLIMHEQDRQLTKRADQIINNGHSLWEIE